MNFSVIFSRQYLLKCSGNFCIHLFISLFIRMLGQYSSHSVRTHLIYSIHLITGVPKKPLVRNLRNTWYVGVPQLSNSGSCQQQRRDVALSDVKDDNVNKHLCNPYPNNRTLCFGTPGTIVHLLIVHWMIISSSLNRSWERLTLPSQSNLKQHAKIMAYF